MIAVLRFGIAVARHPDRALFLRRSVLPAPNNFSAGEPVFGNTLIPTSYAAVQARRTALGSALLALERSGRLRGHTVPATQPSPPEIAQSGVPYFGNSNRAKCGARRGWGVGIWSKNREEWQVVDLACQAYGLVSVSLYETLGPDVAQYMSVTMSGIVCQADQSLCSTNHCPLSIVFAARNHITSLLKFAPRCPVLRVIVSMDPLPRAERELLTQWAASIDVELLDMLELEVYGTEAGVRCDPGPVRGVPREEELDRERIVTISYTSGTTGESGLIRGLVLPLKRSKATQRA